MAENKHRRLKWPVTLTTFLLLILATCGTIIRHYEAALLLVDISVREGQSRFKETTQPPIREEITLEVDNRLYVADLYRPHQPTSASLLLIPGASEGGKNDTRLVAFATSLARARFNVLVPDFESLKHLNVSAYNVVEISDALNWLVRKVELTPKGKVGMLAISYAAGPAILAAMENGIRDRVTFIFAIGGYYDLDAALGFFTTGYFKEGGNLRYIEPNAYGKWVFVLSNLERMSHPHDRTLFKEMFLRKQADLGAQLDDLASELSKEGLAIFSFITNANHGRVHNLLSKLPEAIKEEISELTLADKNLSQLKSSMILVHGLDDNIIPFSQSIALSKKLPAGQTEIFLVDNLAHVELAPGIIGSWKLLRAVESLLAERDKLLDIARVSPSNR